MEVLFHGSHDKHVLSIRQIVSLVLGGVNLPVVGAQADCLQPHEVRAFFTTGELLPSCTEEFLHLRLRITLSRLSVNMSSLPLSMPKTLNRIKSSAKERVLNKKPCLHYENRAFCLPV